MVFGSAGNWLFVVLEFVLIVVFYCWFELFTLGWVVPVFCVLVGGCAYVLRCFVVFVRGLGMLGIYCWFGLVCECWLCWFKSLVLVGYFGLAVIMICEFAY